MVIADEQGGQQTIHPILQSFGSFDASALQLSVLSDSDCLPLSAVVAGASLLVLRLVRWHAVSFDGPFSESAAASLLVGFAALRLALQFLHLLEQRMLKFGPYNFDGLKLLDFAFLYHLDKSILQATAMRL